MASITPYGDRWRAVIRRTGFRTRSNILPTRRQADVWARKIEEEMDSRSYHEPAKKLKGTVAELFQKFSTDVCPGRKGERWEKVRIARFIRVEEFTKLRLDQFQSADLRRWRDNRLKKVKSSSVNRELNLISGIFTHAIKEWGVPLRENPVHAIKRPPQPRARTRRWNDADIEAILKAANWDESVAPRVGRDYVGWAVMLAIETAMRIGELCVLKVGDYDPVNRRAILHDSKNNDPRDVPLSRRAMQLFDALVVDRKPGDKIIPLKSDSLGLYYREVRKLAGVENLTFHDTRHEAATRLSKKVSNVLELSAITGHRSLQSLKRYYNPTAAELATRLD